MLGSKLNRPRVVLVNRCVIENDKGKLFLIQRSKDDYWAGGFWEFPGGKLDKNQSIDQALEREVLEETGLTILTSSRISFVDGRIITSGKYKGLPYVVIFGKAKLVGGKIRLTDEHEDYIWTTPRKAFDLNLTQDSRKALATLY